MEKDYKEKKPHYLTITRKIIFYLVIVMIFEDILMLLLRKDVNRGRLIFTIVQLVAMLFVLRIPQFIQEKYHFQIPYSLDFVLIMFAFCGFVLGDVFNFYGKIPFWDSILHTFSGIVIAYVGFIVIQYLDKEYTIPLSVSPLFMSLIVVSVALAIGAAWEIGEYTVDEFFHTNNQQYMKPTRATLYKDTDEPLVGHDALNDTMKDLMLDLGGAIVVATFEYKKLTKRQKEAS